MRPEQASTYKRVMAPTTSLTAIRSKGVIEQATVLSSAAKTVDVFEGYTEAKLAPPLRSDDMVIMGNVSCRK